MTTQQKPPLRKPIDKERLARALRGLDLSFWEDRIFHGDFTDLEALADHIAQLYEDEPDAT